MNYRKFIVLALIGCLLLTPGVAQPIFAATTAQSNQEKSFEIATNGAPLVQSTNNHTADGIVLGGVTADAESDVNLTSPTSWGWYYHQTAAQINQLGK